MDNSKEVEQFEVKGAKGSERIYTINRSNSNMLATTLHHVDTLLFD